MSGQNNPLTLNVLGSPVALALRGQLENEVKTRQALVAIFQVHSVQFPVKTVPSWAELVLKYTCIKFHGQTNRLLDWRYCREAFNVLEVRKHHVMTSSQARVSAHGWSSVLRLWLVRMRFEDEARNFEKHGTSQAIDKINSENELLISDVPSSVHLV